jgi:hypothetical protein
LLTLTDCLQFVRSLPHAIRLGFEKLIAVSVKIATAAISLFCFMEAAG